MARVAAFLPLVLIAALVGWLLLSDAWTSANPKPADGEESEAFAPDDPPKAQKAAMDWDAKVEPVAFDAKRAMGYLEDVCKLGPRMSGTESMKKQQELLEKHFTKL